MERAKTGIPELDEMLGGGFVKNDTVILAGGAGTGKTTLGLQYLFNGVMLFNEPGIYLTFEEMPDQIYRDALNFGWDLRKLEKEGKFRVIATSPNLVVKGGSLEELLEEPIKQIGAKRIAVDSLSHLAMGVDGDELRAEVYRFTRLLKTKGLSSVLTWEAYGPMLGQAFRDDQPNLGFLVDAIVLLGYVEIESAIRKGIVVLKIRGSDHDKRVREFVITKDGFRVLGPFSDVEGLMSGWPRRAPAENFVELFNRAAKKAK